MKNAKYIFVPLVTFALLVLLSCKKDELKIHKLEIIRESVVKDINTAQITVDYTYPVKLESVKTYLSENSDLSGAFVIDAVIEQERFVVDCYHLHANTQYYYQFEYSNGVDLIKTDIRSFKTDDYSLPTVTTSEVTNITATSAVCGGGVTSAGNGTIIARGVCWSTSQYPTIQDPHTSDGAGTGSFISSIYGLEVNMNYYVRAYATNEKGTSYGNQQVFTTNNGLPTVITYGFSAVTATSATCGGKVTSDGGYEVAARGVCWSINHNPTISDAHTVDGSGTGAFTSILNNLSIQTTYYIRAYATNENGTNYGTEAVLTTQDGLPILTTNEVTNITVTSATCGGNVTSNGGFEVTARGVCWSTSQNPTINDTHTTDGAGLGIFTSEINGLEMNTKYYVRAYATNEIGTNYGAEAVLTTQDGLPILTTNEVTNITATSVTCGGNVTSDGGFGVTARGVCWSTSQNPTINDTHTTDGAGLGIFTSEINGLEMNTKYYVRAYATNEIGTNYGNQKSFKIVPDGAFSVSDNYSVYFSPGNLQYQASTGTWRFAENQYDYIGDANSNISSTYSGWIDLFGWGTSGYNHGAVCYQPYSTSTTNSNYYAYGSYSYNLYDQTGKADWGYNAISNGGNSTNNWRTLTSDEWVYVFNTRSTASGIRYAKAQVNGVNGVILLPDDWNTSTYSLNSTNTSSASYTTNTITSANWSVFEQAGAVFLPAAGWRYGTGVNSVGSSGYYWSASYYDSDCAREVRFYDGHLYADLWNYRNYGRSVRLVCSAEN